MATIEEDSRIHEIESLPREVSESNSQSSEDMTTARESRPLLRNKQQGCCAIVRSKFHSRCCLRSKATILILVWNFIIVMGLGSTFHPNIYTSTLLHIGNTYTNAATIVSGIPYGISVFLLLFYPLAGCLADIRWGRYGTIVNSLCFIFWSQVLIFVLIGLALSAASSTPMLKEYFSDRTISLNTIQKVMTVVVLYLIFGLPIVFGILLIVCSLVAFNANVIQFGLDQLHDAPTEDSILYIHWYVWTSYVGVVPVNLISAVALGTDMPYVPTTLSLLILPFLGLALCIQRYKRHWFLIDSGSRNPYKLVYKVSKFAAQHTYPVHRSAFTYCEDELPSRLDLGKDKYGGPFTTEEVEDVKAFLGILCLLLTLGPLLMVDAAVSGFLPNFAAHIDHNILHPELDYTSYWLKGILGSDGLTSLLIVLIIPLYLCLLRSFIQGYIPRTWDDLHSALCFVSFINGHIWTFKDYY